MDLVKGKVVLTIWPSFSATGPEIRKIYFGLNKRKCFNSPCVFSVIVYLVSLYPYTPKYSVPVVILPVNRSMFGFETKVTIFEAAVEFS
jgi:hypothetical protein